MVALASSSDKIIRPQKGSERYFEPLNPVVKEQYIEKLLLLNSTGDNGPYSDKTSKNSVHHVVQDVVFCGI